MLLERYELGERLAESERNSVRRARRVRDGASLIVKTSTRDYPSVREVRRLEFEYRILRHVESPGVIAALDIERQAGRVALILEDFGGERLSALVSKGISFEHFFPLALSVARSLGHVHARGVMHKDINPSNILIHPGTREVKLIDFSIASELRREHPDATPISAPEGTLPYLSPEQTGRMNRELDYRTDYYSLGVTCFELLTGSLPFQAEDVLGYIHCHLSKAAPDARELNPRVPEGLAQIVAKLMSKNPDARYQSARGLIADLEHCQQTWQESRAIPRFALGQHDAAESFRVSRALLGRDREAAELATAFEQAAGGAARLLLVAGYSGIGKSTLIAEIYRPVVEKRAHFVSGKFEQLERNTPYSAWLEALRKLLRQALSEPERRLAARRERLRAALGNDAAVLFPMLPELGQILGPQPAVAELPARDAQARLLRLFRALLRASATPEQPLVIFLDDLQWSDGSTPELLLQLLGEGQLRHVLILGAYRDNEVSPGHRLHDAIEALKLKRPEAVQELSLSPLTEPVILQMVAATFQRDLAECQGFASKLFQKTGGNPFFVHELLTLLHREGAIRLGEQGSWRWQDDAIEQAAVSDNVVDLVLRRLRGLPPETLEGLRTAACLGKEFDLGLVACTLGKTVGAVAKALWPAVEQQLLWPKGDSARLLHRDPSDSGADLEDATLVYQFAHDRVVESAYALHSERERAELHLRIGRELWSRLPERERRVRVFDFIDHLNRGRALLETQAERVELAELNHEAAQKARRSAAYGTALGYLETSQSLLDTSEWASHRQLEFAVRRIRVECLFLSGQIDRARSECESLFELAPDPVSRVSAFCHKAAIQEQQSQLAEAVETIRLGLAELNVSLPSEAAEIEQQIGAGIGKMLAHLERVPIEDLVRLPALTDPLRIATTELLFQIIPAASQINPPLFILAELVLIDLALCHGTVPGSAKNIMDCGIVFSAILKDYERAYRMGRVAYKLLERSLPTPLESSVNFVFGCFISHWGAHCQEGLDALARGFARGVELGDVLHASYSVVHHAKSLLFAGKELGQCVISTNRALAYTLETGAVGHMAMPRLLRRALGQLTGEYAAELDLTMSDADFALDLEKTQNGHFLLVLGQTQTLVQLVLGDLERASHWDEFATRYLNVGNGAFPVPDYYLFQSLLLARKWHAAGPDERAQILSRIGEHHAQLRVFALASPANFSHKFLLVGAELARITGASIDEVLRLHREITQATPLDFLHVRALAQESLAEFWKEKGHPEFARECLLEAYHLYRHWGATCKLALLEREHGKWLEPGAARAPHGGSSATLSTATATASVDSSSLDVASVLKATLAISGEVKPARLFAVLMQTIIENVGAEHGYLIVCGPADDQLVVAARASVSEAEAAGALALPLESCESVAQDVVRYVARTHETVVLDDAGLDQTHKHDAHIQKSAVKSVLCMPVLSQGRMLAILYVENNAVARAFTHARLLFLRVLAGQAAVSIANAQLYDELELEVAKRTRELSERSREVSAMLNSLEQGVFLIDDQLSIQPRYSAHLPALLGTPEIVGRNCIELLFQDSNLEPDTLDKLQAALDFSFGVPVMFAEANKSHWVREFQRSAGRSTVLRSFEVDWTLIPDDDDKVVLILVALRDVTLLRQISAKAARHARDLDLVGQILDAGVEQFQRFCGSTRELMLAGRESLRPELEPSAETRQAVFRSLHTAKGNARLLGLQHLASVVHLAEGAFDHPRETAEHSPLPEMLAGIARVLAAVEEYEQVYQAKLASALRPPERSDPSVLQAIAARLKDAELGRAGPAETLSSIDQLVCRAGALRLGELLQRGTRLLPVLAQELGKQAPSVEVQDPGLWIGAAWVQTLGECLVHLFQNALDHGIEAAEERVRRQKPAQGTLRVAATRSSRGTLLRFSDDGRGLDLQALRTRVGIREEADRETAQRIFDAGVSTARRVSSISGRGVGLDAVRAMLVDLGGKVFVNLTGPAEHGHQPFEIVIEMPPEATLEEPSAPSRPPLGAPTAKSALTPAE